MTRYFLISLNSKYVILSKSSNYIFDNLEAWDAFLLSFLADKILLIFGLNISEAPRIPYLAVSAMLASLSCGWIYKIWQWSKYSRWSHILERSYHLKIFFLQTDIDTPAHWRDKFRKNCLNVLKVRRFDTFEISSVCNRCTKVTSELETEEQDGNKYCLNVDYRSRKSFVDCTVQKSRYPILEVNNNFNCSLIHTKGHR